MQRSWQYDDPFRDQFRQRQHYAPVTSKPSGISSTPKRLAFEIARIQSLSLTGSLHHGSSFPSTNMAILITGISSIRVAISEHYCQCLFLSDRIFTKHHNQSLTLRLISYGNGGIHHAKHLNNPVRVSSVTLFSVISAWQNTSLPSKRSRRDIRRIVTIRRLESGPARRVTHCETVVSQVPQIASAFFCMIPRIWGHE